MIKTGSQILLESLLKEKVKVVFGYPGGVVLPLYDTLTDYPELRHILVRHEQAAALAADGYARVSGEVGVCIATSGPGATNLLTGIANAYMDSIPMVAITGQVASNMIGSDAFQEVDATGLTMPITKYNFLVDDVRDLAKIVKEAFYIAGTGRPGPVHIDIPVDVFKSSCEAIYPKQVDIPGYKPQTTGSPIQIKKAIELIKKAQRPLILAGHGVLISKASTELSELAEKADIPVITTLLGKSCFPETHPLSIGMLGMHGQAHANFAVHNADLLIGIGMRFDDRITGKIDEFAENAEVIHMDIDPAEIGKNTVVDVPIVGDIKKVLQKLNMEIEKSSHLDWKKQIAVWQDKYQKISCNIARKNNALKAGEVITAIYNVTNGKATVVTDVGQNQMWTAQYYKFDYPGKLLSSGGLGAMGYSLPAAMGAKVAKPKECVWAIMGDGGFQMNSQELMTLVQDKINLKMAILSNGFLGMVRQWQELFYKKNYVATPLMSPDLITLAKAYGIKALRVKTKSDLQKATKEAQNYNKGSILVEYLIEKEENVFPMVPPGNTLKDTLVK